MKLFFSSCIHVYNIFCIIHLISTQESHIIPQAFIPWLYIYWGKKHNFIYSADKTFWIIRIIDFNRAEPACYRTSFHCAILGEQNGAFWYILLHNTTHNAPNIHRIHDSILDLWRTFQNAIHPSYMYIKK